MQTIGTMATRMAMRWWSDIAADIGTMRADQTRIRQALLNHMSNADKFTERHGDHRRPARHEEGRGG